MNRSARAAFLGSAMVAGLMMLGTPLAAQQNGSIYTQCPGDTNGDGVPDAVVPATQRQVHAPGGR